MVKQRYNRVAPVIIADSPSLVFQPETYQGLQKGINVIADAIRPTLGPLPRLVAIDPVSRGDAPPEMLDNGGLIARRILEVAGRDADIGAMLLRQVLWKQHEVEGDGTATTAVLFQSIYNAGVRYIASGGDPMRLRRRLETAWDVIENQLRQMTTPLEGAEALTRLADSICHDGPLADALGQIIDIIGPDGHLEIRSGHSREMTWEFLQGGYYKGGLHAQSSFGVGQRSPELGDVAVFISDLDIEDTQDLIRLIALTAASKKKALVIVARHLSEPVAALLASVSQKPDTFQAIAVKAPLEIEGQASLLDDLAVLTGGRVFLRATGDTVNTAQVEAMGAARRIWANSEYFGIVGGKGSTRGVRRRVAMLRRAVEQTKDLTLRKQFRERIGKLMGGAVIFYVGGNTDLEIKTRKESAERTAEAMRGALVHGYLPGGGAALLACRSELCARAERAADLDERMAYHILSRAIEEPTRAILENAGYEAEPILGQIHETGTGFDVRAGTIALMAESGILDSASVIIGAVKEAIAGAALALTVDVLVHHRKREISVNP